MAQALPLTYALRSPTWLPDYEVRYAPPPPPDPDIAPRYVLPGLWSIQHLIDEARRGRCRSARLTLGFLKWYA